MDISPSYGTISTILFLLVSSHLLLQTTRTRSASHVSAWPSVRSPEPYRLARELVDRAVDLFPKGMCSASLGWAFLHITSLVRVDQHESRNPCEWRGFPIRNDWLVRPHVNSWAEECKNINAPIVIPVMPVRYNTLSTNPVVLITQKKIWLG